MNDKQTENNGLINIPKICVGTFVVYIAFVLSFYFLAGEQLKFRQSRGTVAMPTAESGTVELTQEKVIEQYFTVKIQRLEQISVAWGAYYRANSGAISMELIDTRNGDVLLCNSFDASNLQEGSVLTLFSQVPIEGLWDSPLLLRITANSLPGKGATPLMIRQNHDGWQLTCNGHAMDGTLCFSADGKDYIWTGQNYWKFVAIGGMLIALLLIIVWRRHTTSQCSYIANAILAVSKYRFLIRQLVSRDFKTKYKRSILGVFWSFLNPLLSMMVQYFVFSTVFKSNIPNYAVYLLIGVVTFNFFSEACGMSLTSILGNASLITKVYMPKYIYPLTRVMSSTVNLTISLIPLLLMCFFTGVHLQKAALLALFFLVCVVAFSLGLGMALSASMVFFRDTQFLWNVISMIWMYATPIFYPESIVPETFRWVQTFNPLYHFLKNMRVCILDGISPEPRVYVSCMFIALVMLVTGAGIFRKTQDKFVLYL